MTPPSKITVHRFHDTVAIWFKGTPTVYLTHTQVTQLAATLIRFDGDLRNNTFEASPLGEVDIETTPTNTP